MLCNKTEDVLISASQDQTVFIHKISQSSNGAELIPLGFIPTNATIQQITCFDCDRDKVCMKHFCELFLLINRHWIILYQELSLNYFVTSTANTFNRKWKPCSHENTYFKRYEDQQKFIYVKRYCEFQWNDWHHSRWNGIVTCHTSNSIQWDDFLDFIIK